MNKLIHEVAQSNLRNEVPKEIIQREYLWIRSSDFKQSVIYETNIGTVYEARFSKIPEKCTHSATTKRIITLFQYFDRFFQYIVKHEQDQNRVNISDAGYVTISKYKTMTKPKNVQTIQFDGRRLVNRTQLEQAKQIKEEVMDVKALNTILKEKLLKLEYRNRIEQSQLVLLRKELLERKQGQIKWMEDEKNRLKRASHNTMRIKLLEQKLLELKQELYKFMQTITCQQITTKIIKQKEVDYEEGYGQKLQVEIDLNNKFFEGNYRIQGNRLKKIGIYGSYQVLGKKPFPSNGKHYFEVFVQKISYSIFSLGICNQNRRNYAVSHESPECLTYFAKDGTVWQNKTSRGGGQKIQEGVMIRVVVDWTKNLVKWFKEDNEIGSTNISEDLVGKRIVPYFQLNYPDNSLILNGKEFIDL